MELTLPKNLQVILRNTEIRNWKQGISSGLEIFYS